VHVFFFFLFLYIFVIFVSTVRSVNKDYDSINLIIVDVNLSANYDILRRV